MTIAPAVTDDVRSRLEELGIDLDTVRRIPLNKIQPGRFQPRKHFEQAALEDLADSIRRTGQVETAIVNDLGDGTFELIAGERRWRACKIAERKTLRASVVQITDMKLLAELALLTNSDREPLTDQELLASCIRMREELGMSDDEIARANGRTVQWVSNLMALQRLHARLLPKLGIEGNGGFSRSVGIELIRLATAEQLRAMKELRKGSVGQKRARRIVDAMLADGATRHPDAQERTSLTEAFVTMVMGSVKTAQEAIRRLKTSARLEKIRRLEDPNAGNLRGEIENLLRETRELLEAVGTEPQS